MTEFEEYMEKLSALCSDHLDESTDKDTIVIGGIIVTMGMAMLGSHQATNERLEAMLGMPKATNERLERIERLLMHIRSGEK